MNDYLKTGRNTYSNRITSADLQNPQVLQAKLEQIQQGRVDQFDTSGYRWRTNDSTSDALDREALTIMFAEAGLSRDDARNAADAVMRSMKNGTTTATTGAQPGIDQARIGQDVAALHTAIDGAGTDESAIINILSNRSNEEINAIKQQYQATYGESLSSAIDGDVDGWANTMFQTMLAGGRDQTGAVDEAQTVRDAADIHEAIDGWGTNEQKLIDILANRSGPQIRAISREYERAYGESLRDAITGDTSGTFEDALVAQLNRADTGAASATRPGATATPTAEAKTPAARTPDTSRVGQDVAALHTAIDGAGTDEAAIINILSNRSNAEINAIKQQYQATYGESLSEAIDGDVDGYANTMLQTLLAGGRDESGRVNRAQVVRDAATLHEAIDGWGTTESKLIEVFAGRSGEQLAAIAEEYQRAYGESLRDAITGDTSGTFEDTLVAQLDRATAGSVNPAGVSPAGVNPAGVNPAGVNPAGVNPAGVNPAGVNPAGVNPAGVNPAGVNPAGVNPAGVNPAGVNPAGVNPAGLDDEVASYNLPFIDPATGTLDAGQLAASLQAFGYDPQTAASLAQALAQTITPEMLYQHVWSSMGGQGPINLDAVAAALRPYQVDADAARDLGARRAADNAGSVRPTRTRAQPATVTNPKTAAAATTTTAEPAAVETTRPGRTRPIDNTKIARDVAALHTAIDGAGTDEAALVRILSNRSNAEINAIKEQYQATYGESLSAAIDGDVDGWANTMFQQILAGGRDESGVVDTAQAARDAAALHQAMDGLGTDEQKMLDILSTRSSAQIQAISREYEKAYGESLQSAIEGDTSGTLESVLVAQLNRENTAPTGTVKGNGREDLAAELAARRSVGRVSNGQATAVSRVDEAKVGRDVAALHTAIDGAGTDEDAIINILSNRSNAEINAIKAQYQATYGESLSAAIDGDVDGNANTAMQTLLAAGRDETGRVDNAQAIRDATALHEAIDGWGTNNQKLIDILTSRSGPQIRAIAREYQALYGESLKNAIEGDTSGTFESLLVAQLTRANTGAEARTVNTAQPKRFDLTSG